MCATANSGHIGSSLSVIDILSVLYSGASNITPLQIGNPFRDIVIISKGHAAAGVYAVLANTGFFPVDLLDSYCGDGVPLGGHVTRGQIPGVELSTGSLGHGLPFGTGVALGRMRQGNPGRVFVVMSDGECDEGSNWEAALLAAHHNLRNLTVLIDRNGIQSLDSTERTIRLEPLDEKWRAFGWHTNSIDGHNHHSIFSAIDEAKKESHPTAIVCHTIKGKGVSFMENQVLWHYRSPAPEDLRLALKELHGSD